MNKEKTPKLTREKHLDHMVKVVPFIFLCYGIQSFTLYKIGYSAITGPTLLFLGVALAALTGLFTLYDLKHELELHDEHFTVKFLWYKKEVPYNTILNIDVHESEKTFCKLKISTLKSKHTFYFVDNGEEMKGWLEKRIESEKHSDDYSDFSNAA